MGVVYEILTSFLIELVNHNTLLFFFKSDIYEVLNK